MKHKVYLFLFCLFLFTNDFYAEPFYVDSLWYDFSAMGPNIVEVADNRSYTKSSVDIPKYITYNGTTYEVKRVGSYAFYGNEYITSVRLSDGIEQIGSDAFCNCKNITKINGGLLGVTTIENNAFSGCIGLREFHCMGALQTIGDGTFRGCTKLYRISIPNSELIFIGGYAFADCTKLRLTEVSFSKVTYIGSYAFQNCSNLINISIPQNVTTIAKGTFRNCSSLESVTIPQSVTFIGANAFDGCSRLSDLEIPQKVDSIADFAFASCSGLNSIKVAAENKYYDSRNDCNAIIETKTNRLIAGCQNSFIPYGVREIAGGAFYNCNNLPDSLYIPSSVKSIGNLCFIGCSNLRDVYIMNNIPPTLQDLSWAFGYEYGCFDNIVRIHIPCSTSEIYRTNNYDNSSIEELWNLSVTCQDDAVGIINYIQEYTCENGGATFEAVATDKDWYFYQWEDGNKDNPRTASITSDTTFTAVFAPYVGQCGDNLYWRYKDKTLSITGQGKMWDFANAEEQPWTLLYDSVYTLTFENGVTSVGNNAFRGLQRIAKVVFPAGLTDIGTSAFEQCIRLEDITFGADVADIGDRAFAGCCRVVDMTVYSTATPEIAENTFDGVSSYAYLNVIENCMRKFQIHPCWSRFTLKAIGAETTDDDKFVVEPNTNDADFTWPKNDQAYTYSLEIKKDGEVFCTLTFNANGQLVGIAFAPGRNGNKSMPAATRVQGGYKFTVTGLSEGSHYHYTFDATTEEGKVVDSYRGEFRTNGATATEQIQTAIRPTKTLRNGQVVIRKNGKTYDVLGKQIE